ncbi:photosystem II D2 [Paramyrothecium foliicola]|nr:photosystem II D2 [Paramyrothecium foliicola]
MSLVRPVHQDGFDYEGPANPSVAQHADETDDAVSIVEALQPWPSAADTRSDWRRLSLAPAEVAIEEPRIAAYKVSNTKRYGRIVADLDGASVQVLTGIIACWLASGIVFGFAALKPVLIAEGVYQELCDVDDAIFTTGKIDNRIPCAEQDLRLNLFFIVASITTNVSSLLAGTVLDRFGRRVCWVSACIFLLIGAALLGSSFAIVEFDGYLLGNFFIALGGTFIFVPSYQLTNAFPKYAGIIVALITGSFDASAAVYLLYRWVYEATDGRYSLEKFFFSYMIVPLLILVAEFAYMPAHSYHTLQELDVKIEKAHDVTRDIHDSDEDRDPAQVTKMRRVRADRRESKLDQLEELAGDDERREERIKVEEERQETSVVWGVLHGLPAHRQMMTPWFILILLLTVLQMLRMNYFIATIRAQYRHMLDSEEQAEAINAFFDIALPLGGVASTPLIGLLLDNISIPSVFGVLTIFIVAIGVLNCLPFVWAAYATVIAFVVFRPLYYSAISDYATKVFGFSTFGRIYGTLTCISGLVNFVQSGLDELTHGPLHEDPTPINIAMGAGGAVIGGILTIFVAVKGRTFVEERHDMEGDHERQGLLENDHENYGSV